MTKDDRKSKVARHEHDTLENAGRTHEASRWYSSQRTCNKAFCFGKRGNGKRAYRARKVNLVQLGCPGTTRWDTALHKKYVVNLCIEKSAIEGLFYLLVLCRFWTFYHPYPISLYFSLKSSSLGCYSIFAANNVQHLHTMQITCDIYFLEFKQLDLYVESL